MMCILWVVMTGLVNLLAGLKLMLLQDCNQAAVRQPRFQLQESTITAKRPGLQGTASNREGRVCNPMTPNHRLEPKAASLQAGLELSKRLHSMQAPTYWRSRAQPIGGQEAVVCSSGLPWPSFFCRPAQIRLRRCTSFDTTQKTHLHWTQPKHSPFKGDLRESKADQRFSMYVSPFILALLVSQADRI